MKTHKTDIPIDCIVRQYLPVDHIDAFACEVIGEKRLLVKEIMISFWTIMPDWVNTLFKLRNVLVRPFGLDTGEDDGRSEMLKEMIYAGNGSNGLMSVIDAADNEIVVLLSDKHLDAYMSILIEENENRQTVIVATLVRYHNRLGRIYFLLIAPFHKIIVKSMLKSTIQRMIK